MVTLIPQLFETLMTKTTIACIFTLISITFGQLASAKQSIDQVIAIVNSDIVTRSDLELHTKLLLTRIDPQQTKLPPKDILEQQILNQMILDKVQLQLAAKLGLEADAASIDETLGEIARSENLTVPELRNKLITEGIAFNDYRNHLKDEVLISRLRQREVAQEIVISAADIDGFLHSPVGQDHTGTEYHLAHILISADENSPTPEAIDKYKAKADAVVQSIKAGADFGEVAMAKSAGQNALQGGDLGWRRIGEIPTMFVKYLTSMQQNEVVGPIRSANGFHIIKLIGKRTSAEVKHTETHVRHILVKPGINMSDKEAEHNLNEIRKQIANGAKFTTIAEQKSEELSTAVKGGDLGWITASSVTPAFYAQVMALEPVALSAPFKTELGWHLIEVLGRRSQTNSTEAARNKATEVLRHRKYNELLEAWLKRIRSEAKIEILTK